MSQTEMTSQVVLTGIGGQGILFATKILAETARLRGLSVIGSETHGMSQRGGSVISHLKVGEYHSPLVRQGSADALVALQADEAYRTLRFLRPGDEQRPGGVLLVNGEQGFPTSEVRQALSTARIGLGVVDAAAVANELGSPVVVNLVTLGFAAGNQRFPFDIEPLAETVSRVSPPRFAELNLSALREGHRIAGSRGGC